MRKGKQMYPPLESDPVRPKTTGECDRIFRPGPEGEELKMGAPGFACPFVSCPYHTAIEINKNGAIKFNVPAELEEGDPVPNLQIEESHHTCLRKIFAKEQTLIKTGQIIDVTRERARQIGEQAKAKILLKLNNVELECEGFLDHRYITIEHRNRRIPKEGERWIEEKTSKTCCILTAPTPEEPTVTFIVDANSKKRTYELVRFLQEYAAGARLEPSEEEEPKSIAS